LVGVVLAQQTEVFLSTRNGYGLWFKRDDVPEVGLKTSGVKGINLKEDEVVAISNFDMTEDNYVVAIFDKGTAKRVKLSEFDRQVRARRGLMIIKEVKKNPYQVVKTFVVKTKTNIGIKHTDIDLLKTSEIPIMDRYSTGSAVTKQKIIDAFVVASIMRRTDASTEEKQEEVLEEKSSHVNVSLKEIDERLMTIDDFLKGE